MTYVHNCDPADLIDFANAWKELGDAIQAQVEMVLDEGPDADVNYNAIKLAQNKLKGYNDQIDTQLKEWLDIVQPYVIE